MSLDTQDITNLLTLVLAVGTVWLAIATHGMASATREAVALQAQPYLAIDGVVLGFVNLLDQPSKSPAQAVRVALLISNPGQVRVTYEVEEIHSTFEGEGASNSGLLTRRSIVHPKAQLQFFCPLIPFGLPSKAGQAGEVAFKIAYWASLHKVNHVEGRLKFTYSNVETGRVEWLWLEGPSYSS